MPHSYVSLARMKGTGALDVEVKGTIYDSALLALGEAVTNEIERITHRQFQPRTETKTFDGPGGTRMITPDLISVTSLVEDDNQDGTFSVTWGTNDYALTPYDANPTQDWGQPHTGIVVSAKTNGTQDNFLTGQRRYQVTGTWGYRYVTVDSGLTGTMASTATSILTLSGQVGTTIGVGHSLEYNSEVVYVTNVASTTSTAVTVRRAQQGSTATSGTAQTVNIFQYPGPIQEAAFIQAARLWKRKDSAFASEAGLTQFGQINTFRGGLDEDVRKLLMPYRRPGV